MKGWVVNGYIFWKFPMGRPSLDGADWAKTGSALDTLANITNTPDGVPLDKITRYNLFVAKKPCVDWKGEMCYRQMHFI